MAIGVRAQNAGLFGTASQTPTIHGAQVIGDMMLIVASGKPFDAAWTVPGGWTALGRGQSGTTAAGVDTGSMAMQVFYKEAVADPETNPLITEGTPAWNVGGGIVHTFSKDAGEVWEAPVVVYGADETTGTAISVTYASDPGVTTGDLIVANCAINTELMGPLTGILTPTQTGITFGTTTLLNDTETTSGGDMSYHATTTPVTSGTSSAAPAATGTGTTTGGADRLEAGFIRLRVSAAPPVTTKIISVIAGL